MPLTSPVAETGAVKAVGNVRCATARPPGLAASAVLLAKPGIVAAVALEGMTGMAMAANGWPPAGKGAACIAAILLAAAGSAVANNVLEAQSDLRMGRLRDRSAALRGLGKGKALLLASFLVASSAGLAAGFLDRFAALLLAAAVASYVAFYTLWLKSRSPYGTIPGGVPGALPVLVGYAAASGRVGTDGILLFLLMLLWQPPHFWALALKCRDDYRAAGIPVLPVSHGEAYTRLLLFLYAVPLLPVSLAPWWFGYRSGRFAVAAFLLWAYYILSCRRNLWEPSRYGRAFRASIVYILGIFAAILADILLSGRGRMPG